MKKYIELTKKQLDELEKDKIVLVSVVSPIEIHGSHLPVGTDIMIATEVMRRTVKAMGHIEFIELPSLCTGAQPLPVKGSLGVSYKTLYKLLLDIGKGISDAGFKKWVVFDNHGGPSHMLAEADAAKKLKKRGIELIVPFIGIMNGMNMHDPAIGLGSERDGSMLDAHAGTNETSLYMAIYKAFDDNKYETYAPPKTFAGKLIRLLGSESLGMNIDWINDSKHPSYIGNPSQAEIDSGEIMLDYHVKKSIDAINGNYNHKVDYNFIIKSILRVIG